MSNKILLLTTVIVAGLTAACGGEQKATAATDSVKGAKVERIALSTVDDYYEAVGTVRSKTAITLSSKVLGNVVSMRVREGDRIRTGQIIAEIDNRDTVSQLARAQAGLREAERGLDEAESAIRAAEAAKAAAENNKDLAGSTFKRYQNLLDRKSVSPQEYDEVRTKYLTAIADVSKTVQMRLLAVARKDQSLARIEQAKAEVSTAQVYVGYSRITSPINGIVTVKNVDIGTQAAPGVPLVTIEDDSRYRLEVSVEESKLNAIHQGDEVTVQIDAVGAQELSGKIAEILPTSDPATRSYTVKIDLLQLDSAAKSALRSGLFGKARFKVGQRQVLVIPQKASTQTGQLTSVYVVDSGGIARMRIIKTGKQFDDRIEVLSGLNERERIVVSASDGIEKIVEGSRVQ